MKRMITLIVVLALSVSMPYLLLKVYRDNKELKESGIDVRATIIKSEGVGAGGTGGSVTVEYKNEKGETVTAKGIINDGNKDVGRTFSGKYLPGKEDTVYLPAKKTLVWFLYALFGGMTALSWGMLISIVFRKATGRSVGRNGIIARAQVMNYDAQTRMLTVSFKRADGIDCTASAVSDIPYGIGAYINIKYVPKGMGAKIIILGY